MTVESYYPVLAKLAGNKIKEKPLKIDKIAALLAGNNDTNDKNDEDSYSTITTTIWTEEGNITGPNTATTDEGKNLGLGKTNEEESERRRI